MKEEIQILFDRYLKGQLSPEEALTFNARLETDHTFKQDFELYKAMNGFIDEKVKNQNALDVLREVHEEETNKSTGSKRNNTYWLLVIIVIGLAFLTYYGYSAIKQTQRINKVMAMYEFPPAKGLRSVEFATTKIDSAIHFFDLREFDKSEELFLQVLDAEPENQEANLYMGHIMFLEKEFEKSLTYLSKVEDKNNNSLNVISLINKIRISDE